MAKKLSFTEHVFERVKMMCAQKEWDFEVNEENQIVVKSESNNPVIFTSFPKLREIHIDYKENHEVIDVSFTRDIYRAATRVQIRGDVFVTDFKYIFKYMNN